MKRIMLFTVLVCLVLGCKNEEATYPSDGSYVVNVTAEGIYDGIRTHLLLVDERRQEVAIDTAMMVGGMATFSGKIDAPKIVLLSINGVRGNTQLILEPGVTNITAYKDSIQVSKIEGGKNNEVHDVYKTAYRERRNEMMDARRMANVARRDNDMEAYNKHYNRAMQLNQGMRNFNHEFIAENADTDFALLLLETLIIGQGQDVDKFKSNYELLQPVIKRSMGNKQIGMKIYSFIKQKESLANLEIGKIAPDFAGPSPEGEEIALADIKGKATIIDFWASWCKPCRVENPNVVRVYEKYHDKGLEIISVSLDREGQKAAWLKAIEDDKLTWHHVSSLKYFNDPIAQLYHITAIPATFILDEDGRIVAKRLRGKALEDQIASMLN